MLAEAAAALITLHCATQVSAFRDDPAMGAVRFTVTVDYAKNYAYIDGDRRVIFEPWEISELEVTPGQIVFPTRSQDGVIFDGGTISRVDGAVNVTFESAFFKDGRGKYRPSMTLQGRCTPGDLVEPPKPAF